MIVDVAYPAPLLHVPHRARTERVGFALMRAPMRLRRVPPGSLEPAAHVRVRADGTETLHACEGSLWRQAGPPGSPEASAAALADFLADPGAMDRHPGLRDHLTRSPLVAAPLHEAPSRGDVDPERSRRIAHDGRPGIRERLDAFLASDVLLCGDGAYLRCQPVATSGVDRRAAHPGSFLRLAPGHWRAVALEGPGKPHAALPFQAFPARADRTADFRAWALAHTGSAGFGVPRPPEDHGVPAGLAGDGDVLLMANVLPEVALEAARTAVSYADIRNDPARAAFEGRVKDLLPLALSGMVGGVGLEDAERAIELSAAVAAEVEAYVAYPGLGHELRTLASWLDTLGRPRLREIADARPDDRAALEAALAP